MKPKTPIDVAKLWRVHISDVWDMIHAGVIQTCYVEGRRSISAKEWAKLARLESAFRAIPARYRMRGKKT
jgi:hypothetical protein